MPANIPLFTCLKELAELQAWCDALVAGNLWLVGQSRAETPEGVIWDFQGVFATEAEAVAACRTSAYWVAPVKLGEVLPDESSVFPGFYVPHRQPD